jgi:phosphoribosylaminoimidazolecarboxamide formyltransferase / IMP cyclohydrolase
MSKAKRALISVWDKKGINKFAEGLIKLGWDIISTGGTAKKLIDSGIQITEISDYTKSPEMLNGRVKTLHPKIHGGILAIRDNENHINDMVINDIAPIDIVVVNFYPFIDVIKKEDVSLDEAIENIDIGGPTMLRAAAKNFKYATIIHDPEDYNLVLKELKKNNGHVSVETNYNLAVKAFSYVANYDAAISNFLGSNNFDGSKVKFPDTLTVHFNKKMGLRYGENPHQDGAFYIQQDFNEPSISNSVQIQGKELSLNNIYDTDSALEAVKEFNETACVIVKHNNPCGIAIGDSVLNAFLDAKECDPVSSFGGIVAFNTDVDETVASELTDMFLEVIIAPAYTQKALDILSTKKNLRVLKTPPLINLSNSYLDLKKVTGGALFQDKDLGIVSDFKDLRIPTKKSPSDDELNALKFAWVVCKHVKSNSIVLANTNQTVAIGAGQMSRVDSVKLCGIKANIPTEGSVLASDAFFPFRDGIDEAAKLGVSAIIQPGGSIRDQDIIDACDELGISMVFTGFRHFKH